MISGYVLWSIIFCSFLAGCLSHAAYADFKREQYKKMKRKILREAGVLKDDNE